MQNLTIYSPSLPNFDGLPAKLKQIRNEEINALGVKMLKTVLAQIPASGVNDAHGKIQGWQAKYVGSGHGYSAVRAVATGAGVSSKDSPGAITNYLTSGHKVRSPSGKAKRYRPNVHKAKATAYRFYAQSEQRTEALLTEARKRIETAMANAVEESK